ncbi:hypothetical protein ABTE00_20720, partial [Acinetobacter baumannii]
MENENPAGRLCVTSNSELSYIVVRLRETKIKPAPAGPASSGTAALIGVGGVDAQIGFKTLQHSPQFTTLL